MQQHVTQCQTTVWLGVDLYFLKFGSDVHRSGALKERDIYRDQVRSLQGLERLSHKKTTWESFCAWKVQEENRTRNGDNFAEYHGVSSPGSVIRWLKNKISSRICSGIKLQVRIVVRPHFCERSHSKHQKYHLRPQKPEETAFHQGIHLKP